MLNVVSGKSGLNRSSALNREWGKKGLGRQISCRKKGAFVVDKSPIAVVNCPRRGASIIPLYSIHQAERSAAILAQEKGVNPCENIASLHMLLCCNVVML